MSTTSKTGTQYSAFTTGLRLQCNWRSHKTQYIWTQCSQSLRFGGFPPTLRAL